MSKAAAEAPSTAGRALQWFSKNVCLDILNPDDEFNTLLRKIAIMSGFFALPAPVIYLLLNVQYGLVHGFTWGVCGFMAGLVIMFVTFLSTYLWARAANKPSNLLMDVWCMGTFVGIKLATFTGTYPTQISNMALLLNAIICDTPRMPLYVALVIIAYPFSAYNSAAVATQQQPLFLPGTKYDTFPEMLQNYVSAYFIFGIPVVSALLQQRQSRKMIAAARAAVRLSGVVTEHLRDYDTDAVERELEAYRKQTDVVADEVLLANYDHLVSNLNKYRPHLPNWMVGGTGTEDVSAASERSTRSTRSTIKGSVNSRGSSVPSSAPGPVPPGITSQGGGFHRRRQVAFAALEFAVDAALSPSTKDAAVTSFVDSVHEWAALTSGSLHSFVGDVLQVSWNATHNVAQPEAKAARFLAKVAVANADAGNTGVTAYGAAFSGKAACNFSGTGRVQALTLSMQWRDCLRRYAVGDDRAVFHRERE
jgi:hypothetical protein